MPDFVGGKGGGIQYHSPEIKKYIIDYEKQFQ